MFSAPRTLSIFVQIVQMLQKQSNLHFFSQARLSPCLNACFCHTVPCNFCARNFQAISYGLTDRRRVLIFRRRLWKQYITSMTCIQNTNAPRSSKRAIDLIAIALRSPRPDWFVHEWKRSLSLFGVTATSAELGEPFCIILRKSR